MIGVYVVGVVVSLALATGCLIADVVYDEPPRKCVAKFLLRVVLSLAWPIGLPVWLGIVCYSDRWDVL